MYFNTILLLEHIVLKYIAILRYYKIQQISMIEAIDMLLFLNETSLQIEGVDATTNASVL